jgi:hypothetical protein
MENNLDNQDEPLEEIVNVILDNGLETEIHFRKVKDLRDIQFNLSPSNFFKQKPNPDEMKEYVLNYSHIAMSYLEGGGKMDFIQFLLEKFPSRKNILLCSQQIDNVDYLWQWEQDRTILWNLLLNTVLSRKKPILPNDYSIILDLLKVKDAIDLLDKYLPKKFVECVLSFNNELKDSTYKSIIEIIFCDEKIDYDILENEKLNDYFKSNIELFFDIAKRKHKLYILSYILDKFPTTKNILFIINKIQKHRFTQEDKDNFYDKLYSVVLSKKLSGLRKSHYLTFLINSKESRLADKLFDYLLSQYKLKVDECFKILNTDIKENHKIKLVDYIDSNFDLDDDTCKKLLKFPVSDNLKQKIINKLSADESNFSFLKQMYISEVRTLKSTVLYLEDRVLNYQSIYDYESDYEVELEVINSNRIYSYD